MTYLSVTLTITVAIFAASVAPSPAIDMRTGLPEIYIEPRNADKPIPDTNKRAMEDILEGNAEILEDDEYILIEGDIYMGPDAAYNALRDINKIWEEGVVPFEIHESIDSEKRVLILDAIRHYHERTCIVFVERTNEKDYIQFIRRNGCWSSVGRSGGRQKLSIGDGCKTLGTIIHEIMHALGFYHEQSRTDRDDYVTIKWNNIVNDDKDQFDKYDHFLIDPLGAPYDYASVMHYDAISFSKNGKATIVPKQADVGLIDRNYFSKWDLFKINKLYNCAMTGLEFSVLPGTGECFEDRKEVDYRGTISTTKTGKTCQNWLLQSPHPHPYKESDNDRLTLMEWGLGDHNYCRNPDDDSRGAWCYTTDPDLMYDFCDVGAPGENCAVTSPMTPFPTVMTAAPPLSATECYRKRNGSDYRGIVSTTKRGDKCLVWSDVEFILPDEDNNHNFCRNPDKDSKPWCFTDDGYDYCNVPRRNQYCQES